MEFAVVVGPAPALPRQVLLRQPECGSGGPDFVTAQKQSGQCLLLRHDRERVRPTRGLGKMPALPHFQARPWSRAGYPVVKANRRAAGGMPLCRGHAVGRTAGQVPAAFTVHVPVGLEI